MKFGIMVKTLQEYGVTWAAWRAAYALAMKSGYFRRGLYTGQDPVKVLVGKCGGAGPASASWLVDRWTEHAGRFFLPTAEAARQLPPANRAAIVLRADAVLDGRFSLFSIPEQRGFPPDWFAGQAGYAPWSPDGHWSQVADMSAANGDIKRLWELSRFTHAFDLGRAYLCTGDEKYAGAFWRLCESWWAANPLETGPHWRCGQEMSFRIMAWIFGLHAMRSAAASTPERVGRLIAHLWHHGCHVEKVNWYAVRCVRNNHAISEAVALRTLGLIFPFFPESDRWQQSGQRSLDRELSWQVADDGTYVQQSNNYARLVAQLLTWNLSLEQANGTAAIELAVVQDRGGRLVDQLQAQVAGCEGELPNYGSNDGALLFPCASCGYRDYRPALDALSRTLGRRGLPGDGPWQEEAFWFGQAEATAAPVPAMDVSSGPALQTFPAGGLHVMRNADQFVFLRCGPTRHRPAEADMLQVDYWRKGRNILLDAGTYRYNVAPAVRDYFAGSRAHNTVTVDNADQMQRGSRFLWHNWTQGVLDQATEQNGETVLQGHHTGYDPVTHHRAVHLSGRGLLVVDDLTGGSKNTALRLHWLMCDLPRQDLAHGVALTLPDGESVVIKIWCDHPLACDVVVDQPDPPRGVWSPHYGVMLPACSLAATTTASRAQFVTFAGPAATLAALTAELDQAGENTVAQVRAAWQALLTPEPGTGTH